MKICISLWKIKNFYLNLQSTLFLKTRKFKAYITLIQKTLNTIFVILISLSMSLKAFALQTTPTEDGQKILIRTETSSLEDYKTFLEKNPDFKSPSYEVLSNKEKTIYNLNQLAEMEFLNSDLAKPLATYKSITDLTLDSLWSSQIREIIFKAYFRIAQIDKKQWKNWIFKAYVFAPDLTPDTETTPTSLIQEFKEIKENADFLNLNEKFQSVYINSSKNINSVHKNKIYRVDSVTLESLPSTQFLTGEEVVNYKPQFITFSGFCDEIKVNKTNFKFLDIKQNYFVFSSFKCKPTSVDAILAKDQKPKIQTPLIVTSSENISEIEKTKSEELALHLPQKNQPEVHYTQTLSNSPNLTQDFSSLNTNNSLNLKTKKNSRWIYIASSVLALTLGAMLIQQNDDKSNTYEPTRSNGFE